MMIKTQECSSQTILIPVRDHVIKGELRVPPQPKRVVLIAHGSGCDFQSPQNRSMAGLLNRKGMATLSVDLVDCDEKGNAHNVFDVELQASRVIEVTRWLAGRRDTGGLPVGYLGTGIGSAAMLLAAALEPGMAGAIVSGAGRVDAIEHWLVKVAAPTLLVVGEDNRPLAELSRRALARLNAGSKSLDLVSGVSQLLDEPGGLDGLSRAAGKWFTKHLLPDSGAGKARAHGTRDAAWPGSAKSWTG